MPIDHPSTRDPDGRVVVFDAGSYLHLAQRRPWLLGQIDVILATISAPELHANDPIPGRERFYSRHTEPGSWLRIIVDFNEQPAWVVTALVQDFEPGD